MVVTRNSELLPGICLCLCLALSSGSLSAHHGLNEYDTDQLLELQGTVVGFELQEPHSLLYVAVEKDGQTVTWAIEGGSGAGIVKAGLTKAYLGSRPAVTVFAYQSKDGRCEPMCRAAGRDFEFEDQDHQDPEAG